MSVQRAQIATAVQLLRTRLQWKPGSLERHLNTRRKRGHLPADATTLEYEAIIRAVISNAASRVYLFQVPDEAYVALVEPSAARPWLVMCDLRGIMETAFIVENPQGYLSKNEFLYIDTVQQVLRNDRPD